jgi:chromate transporter
MNQLFYIFYVFLRLGCISFGGPIAHIGYFHKEFVEDRKWLDEAHYADLMALCQFLPGPTSSQIGYSIGVHRGGIPGGFAAWLGFTLPSALLMVAFAYGVSIGGWLELSGGLQGLKIAAVAVVTDAILKMQRKLAPDFSRLGIVAVVALVLFFLHAPLLQILCIAAGAFLGVMFFTPKTAERSDAVWDEVTISPKVGAVLLCGYFLLLLCLFLPLDGFLFNLTRVFYGTGSLVFGGGHVILPLLEEGLVPQGLIDRDVFLSGYGAAQALPGPLFALSSFVGTSIGGIGLGFYCLIMLYLPSFLLVPGLLPFWGKLRRVNRIRGALVGANAAVVGLLVSAYIHPIISSAVYSLSDALVALGGVLLLVVLKKPSWVVVLFCFFSAILLNAFGI